MTKKQITQKINNRKLLLNFLLKYFSPGNRFIIYLSQDLDKHISRYQHNVYRKLKKSNIRVKLHKVA